jgi:phosphoribosyl 1,2-cyclic phosphate phosphodiesterase
MNGTSGGGPGGSNPDTGNNESPGSNPAGPLNIVIDAGPDFRAQMLGAGVTRLDAILLTHEHKDHTGGIDDVRAYNYFGQTPLDIWATERVQESVRRDYWYAFEEHPYPGAPEIALHTIADGPFIVQSRAADGTAGTKSTKSATGVEIIPIRGCHMKLPVTGFRIGRLAYLTDFNRIDDAEVEKLLGVETLVVNALGHKEHISHFNLEQALELSRRVGARATWLTHIAHRMGLYADIDPTLPPGVHLAYDGLTIEI